MNITDHFVFVHLPKTGGTFFSDCLRKIHGDHLENFALHGRAYWALRRGLSRVTGRHLRHEELAKHANCREIPERAAGLPIFSTMRHPFDWYVSNYRFEWWKTNPDEYPGLRDDPRWPALSFADYMELSSGPWLNMRTPEVVVNPSLGRLTAIFVAFYCRDPGRVLAERDESALRAAFMEELFPVEFLEMSALNAETHRVLSRYYSETKIGFVAEKAKIAPRGNRGASDTVDRYFDAALKAEMLERDRLLFELFPQYLEA